MSSRPVNTDEQPQGILTIRTLAMPANTNTNGDIFGGWVVANMDLAAGSIARNVAKGRVTTVAIDKLEFISPVKVGDFICCYADLIKVGRTSMTINVQTWSVGVDEVHRKVTEGVIVYVAIDENGRPVPVPKATS